MISMIVSITRNAGESSSSENKLIAVTNVAVGKMMEFHVGFHASLLLAACLIMAYIAKPSQMKARPESIRANMVDTAEMTMADCSVMNEPFRYCPKYI